MERVLADKGQPTHVVANLDTCLTFSTATQFSKVAAEIDRLFGFLPSSIDELANNWTKIRPDLLIGAFHPDQETLSLLGEGVALDPGCSTIVRDAAHSLGVLRARRTLLHGLLPDIWVTEVSDMRGRLPAVLYHGTTDAHLKQILAGGLRTDMPSNWPNGGRDHVYLTATAQTAAFHARRTADRTGGKPIVLACRKPWRLEADWDVQNQLVHNQHVPSQDSALLANEAGLFASKRPVSRIALLEVLEPEFSVPAREWRCRKRAGCVQRALSWFWR